MAKFIFIITAHVGNDCMLVYSRKHYVNSTEDMGHSPILAMCMSVMGYRNWTFDDGDDIDGSCYCQYVSYDKYNKDNYLLAAWYELDEKGCVKL